MRLGLPKADCLPAGVQLVIADIIGDGFLVRQVWGRVDWTSYTALRCRFPEPYLTKLQIVSVRIRLPRFPPVLIGR